MCLSTSLEVTCSCIVTYVFSGQLSHYKIPEQSSFTKNDSTCTQTSNSSPFSKPSLLISSHVLSLLQFPFQFPVLLCPLCLFFAYMTGDVISPHHVSLSLSWS